MKFNDPMRWRIMLGAGVLARPGNVLRFTGGANLSFQAWTTEHSSLKLVAAGGGDLFTQKATVIGPPELFWQQSQALPGVSSLAHGTSRSLNWNLNAIHTYSPGSGSWRATTSVGTQYEDRHFSRDNVVAQGLIPGQTNIDQGSTLGQQFELTTTERTLAFYGQEEMAFLGDRLLFTAGVRAERSSANGDDGKYYLFSYFEYVGNDFKADMAGTYRLMYFPVLLVFLVVLFALVWLPVLAVFLATAVRVVVLLVREERATVFLAVVFRVVVELHRVVFGVAGAASSPAAVFLRIARLVVVPSCWGFSSAVRCTATTLL